MPGILRAQIDVYIPPRHQTIIGRTAEWRGTLSSWKIPSPAVPAENHVMAVHIVSNVPPFLTVGKRQSRSCTGASVLQTGTGLVLGRSVKDSSDPIAFFHKLFDQGL
ncbi:hypothetical protein TNCV_4866431 [Trichonephila clavipes]|nr:hypothetical protein TNCV_4866431 [Trichonephila clavipes]